MRPTTALFLTPLLGAFLGCDTPMGNSGLCAASAIAFSPTVPDFIARVSQVHYEDGLSPMGPMSQYDLWLTISPATSPNAGLVIGRNVPVFVRSSAGTVMPASVCSIAQGDIVEVWHDQTVANGAVEAPPSAPAFFGTQVVIHQ